MTTETSSSPESENSEIEQTEGQPAASSTAADFGFVPESFVKDGVPDTQGFRADYDALASFKSQHEEFLSALPKTAEEYAFDLDQDSLDLPEGFTLPEGVNLGVDKDDPDLPALKALAKEHNVPQGMLNGLAKIMAQREVRRLAEASEFAATEMKKLGPNAQSRIDHLARATASRLSETEHQALMDSVSSSEALRALEKLLNTGTAPSPGGPGGKPNWGEMSIDERLKAGLARKATRAA